MYKAAFPKAVWKEKDSTWVFPSGARLWFTFVDREDDTLRFQGQEYTWVGFDELTQYATPAAWNYLRSRVRTGDPDLPTYMRATTNPGGPGHQWVKKMFIDPAPPNTTFDATDIETGEVQREPDIKNGKPNPKAGQPLFQRKFIPATLFDNPHLGDEYYRSLLSLPEHLRNQLLEGDWSSTDGAAFGEFKEKLHTCEPFDIPHDWTRFRSCDFGYGSHSAVHWYAIDPNYDTLYVYRELYVSKMNGEELADKVLELERGERIQYGVLDSSCWHQRGMVGPSIAESMMGRGCRWRPSDRSQGSRIAGRMRLHELLKPTELATGDVITGIKFFNTCRQIIADLPMIPTDPKGSDDIDPRYASDHAYDSIRYGIMSRPRKADPFSWRLPTSATYEPADPVLGY